MIFYRAHREIQQAMKYLGFSFVKYKPIPKARDLSHFADAMISFRSHQHLSLSELFVVGEGATPIIDCITTFARIFYLALSDPDFFALPICLVILFSTSDMILVRIFQ
jgi:hypothetical protein